MTWHINHPGKVLSIYEIAALAKIAYFESFTGKNITSAFSKPGICPFNKLIFSDENFAPCNIYTNELSQDATPNTNLQASTNIMDKIISDVMPTSIDQTQSTPPRMDPLVDANIILFERTSSASTAISITPESVRPFPKITKTVTKRKRQQKGKSRIYTDSPEKHRLRQLHNIKEQTRLMKEQKQHAKDLKTVKKLLDFYSDIYKQAKKKKEI